jgi:hypothetical protein
MVRDEGRIMLPHADAARGLKQIIIARGAKRDAHHTQAEILEKCIPSHG